jgi:hypothetical protein
LQFVLFPSHDRRWCTWNSLPPMTLDELKVFGDDVMCFAHYKKVAEGLK